MPTFNFIWLHKIIWDIALVLGFQRKKKLNPIKLDQMTTNYWGECISSEFLFSEVKELLKWEGPTLTDAATAIIAETRGAAIASRVASEASG